MLKNPKQWRECHDATWLFETALRKLPRREWRRSARLAACAVFRSSVLSNDLHDVLVQAVDAAEDFADGHDATIAFHHYRSDFVLPGTDGLIEQDAPVRQIIDRLRCASRDLLVSCQVVVSITMETEVQRRHGDWSPGIVDAWKDTLDTSAARCADVVRDVLRCPFAPRHPRPPMDADLERWSRRIYNEGRFEELPVLGDALEEAGFDDIRIIRHLQQSGPHYRGCWALDALLQNEP